MQILHVGELVRARRDRWRVVDTKAFDGCQLITIAGATAANYGVERRLLAPFDAIDRIPSSHVPQLVGRVRWRRVLRDTLRRGVPGELRATANANIDLLPHQLQPALAVVRGLGCRLLLADDVGLGKTIEAGAIVAELRARGAADRVLILTPPGLRDQWAQELLGRFDIRADIVDFRSVRERVATLRPGVNPWTTWPVAIASVDYVKRSEVLRAVVARPWDVVIVDEAHRVANDGDRHDAVASIASHAGYVILLTATPHNGDTQAFKSLCGIGGQGDRLLVFRRTRRALSSAVGRRAHRLLVRTSAAERRMHARLTDFERAVCAERGDADRDAWIALAVLRKRAFSSAQALNLSIARRLGTLGPATLAPVQLPLPLDELGERDGADDAPPWQAVLALQDADQERRLLTSMSVAAAAATGHETKLAAIGRLIRRIAEPLVIFTEFRDTLVHVARSIQEPVAVLHGGLSRHERIEVLRAFTEGRRRILLATEAAGEGLNLHQTCRIVINLELPWNPMRLEQRIGRVDRIGQRRTVHAFHLVAAGTGEEQLLAGLRDRIAHAQTEIGAPDPFGSEWAVPPEQVLPAGLADVSAEIARLGVLRALAAPPALPHRPPFEIDRPLMTFARHRSTRQRLGQRMLFIWEVDVEDRVGRPTATCVVATAAALACSPPTRSEPLQTIVAPTATDLIGHVESSAHEWRLQVTEARRGFVDARLARERAIQSSIDSQPQAGIQPGLFDGRAAHTQAADRAALAEMADVVAQRIALLESIACVGTTSRPRLRLILLPQR
jgi:superfamily II DNA or RNA helicase